MRVGHVDSADGQDRRGVRREHRVPRLAPGTGIARRGDDDRAAFLGETQRRVQHARVELVGDIARHAGDHRDVNDVRAGLDCRADGFGESAQVARGREPLVVG